MSVWNTFPMLRVIPPFLIGVIGAAFLTDDVLLYGDRLTYTCFGLLFASLVVSTLALPVLKRARFGVMTYLVMGVLGVAITLSVTNSIFPKSFAKGLSSNSEQTYLATVVDEPIVKPNSIKVVANLADNRFTLNGKVLLYFETDSIHTRVKYGDVLMIRTKLERVQNQGNPNEFNYQRYLRFHGISFRGYVATGKSEVLISDSPGIWGWFYSLRSRLITKLKEARVDGNELSVASALVLGYRADLDNELMSAYAGAGATHVLAVSGLHVGIVYMILNTLLKFLDKRRSTKIFKTALLVIFLFGYAGLTGLSASVFRAATMFSFVAVGRAIKRDTNIFNTLAASAFVLIAFNPMIIMQVGFQLSYAAVLGIVIIQPILFKLYSFPNSRLLDWAWSITCVSIAAQIATAPLGLLYFHQFPNFFWISNLLVIPAAGVILYLGFMLFVFSFWEPLLLFFGFLLEKLIYILNQLVVYIQQIPYSVLSGIDISVFEALMIYMVTIGFLLFILKKSKIGFYHSLLFAIVFMVFQIVEVYEQRGQHFVTVYNVRDEAAIALFNGTEVTFLGSSDLYRNEQSMLFHIRHHWWKMGVETERFIELTDSLTNRELRFGHLKFSVLNSKFKDSESELNVHSEYHKLDFAVIERLNPDYIGIFERFQGKIIASNNYSNATSLKSLKEQSNYNSVVYGAVELY